MYRTIIFDFDGTIADTFSVFYTILRKLGPEIGVGEITPEDILEYRQRGVKELIKRFKIKVWKIPFLIEKGQKMFGECIEDTSPFEGISEVLRQIFEAKIKLGVITTNSKDNVRLFLKKHDLEIFDFVVSTPSLLGKKGAIKRAIKKYKLDKKETIYIGDEIRDIESAESAGVKSGAVTWGYNAGELLEKETPDFTFEIPTELLKLIKN